MRNRTPGVATGGPTPKRKQWTILVVMVANDYRRGATDEQPEYAYINYKAEENLEALSRAAAALKDDVWVATYTIWEDASQAGVRSADNLPFVGRPPEAQVLATKQSSVGWFDEGIEQAEYLENNLVGFYAWALPRCPAEHYAVVFWGHSFGPGGLFDDGAQIKVPSPLLKRGLPPMTARNIAAQLRRARANRMGRVDTDENRATLAAKAAPQLGEPRRDAAKIDLAVFHSCWMSTLETAFEICDEVRFAIASQSHVPFGYPTLPTACALSGERGSGVWEYEEIFRSLLDFNGGVDSLKRTMGLLDDFYSRDNGRHAWPDPIVTFSLLDLGALDDGTYKSALAVVGKHLLSLDEGVSGSLLASATKAVAIEYGSMCDAKAASRDVVLGAGCIALVDVRELCSVLRGQFPLNESLLAAIAVLETSPLVAKVIEATNSRFRIFGGGRGRISLDFGGVSFFYHPQKALASDWKNVDRSIFRSASKTTFGELKLGQLMLTERKSWNDLAFEQK